MLKHALEPASAATSRPIAMLVTPSVYALLPNETDSTPCASEYWPPAKLCSAYALESSPVANASSALAVHEVVAKVPVDLESSSCR